MLQIRYSHRLLPAVLRRTVIARGMYILCDQYQARIYAQAPRAANFQGRHIKKIEIEVWYAGKKGCPRERNLREIYTENNVGTEFSRYDATGARRS